MIIELTKPDSLKLQFNTLYSFKEFVQMQLNRLCVGELRYGTPSKRKLYLTRLKKEVQEYERTGNKEHLINISNYCILESIKPEHPNHHFDATVDSATRARHS